MAATNFEGPLFVSGDLAALRSPPFAEPVPDYANGAGVSAFYQGTALIDPRCVFLKDKVTGYAGSVFAHLTQPVLRSISAVPSTAASTAIAAGQNVTSGTAMTLAAASVGITVNVPIRPFSASLNGAAPVTAAIVLDFGFAFGNCTAGSATIQVADSTQFVVGMPLVIGGVGNSGGTAALLTQVVSIVDATHITVLSWAVPAATNATAPIGTGDLWGPYGPLGYPLPQAAAPVLAAGSALMLDPRQAIARGIAITGLTGSTGGTFLVSGADIYGETMSESIPIGAGAVTAYGHKAFKAIFSVTPQFTDAHNYSIGTSDVFGFHYRSTTWESSAVCWAGATMTTNAGWTGAVITAPATSTTGDVRGTIQASSAGTGTGIGANASNGVISGLVMTGRRLDMALLANVADVVLATGANPAPMFGVTQA